MNPLLQKLYDEIKSPADIEKMCTDSREEDLYLEFKEKHANRRAKLDTDDSKSFSQSLSAFANAGGGVLIFGVKTEKSIRGVDAASAPMPITDHTSFRSRLMDSILQTTVPPIDGIVSAAIPETGTEGYVKFLIPPSDKTPHMASVGKSYFRRSSTGRRAMEHFEIQDMFGTRQRPELEVLITFKAVESNTDSELMQFFLLNVGRVVAKYSGLHVTLTDTSTILEATAQIPMQEVSSSGYRAFAFGERIDVVHPNGIHTRAGGIAMRRKNAGQGCPLKLIWYCENMQTKTAEITMEIGKTAQIRTIV
jgi:hypothetical protein